MTHRKSLIPYPFLNWFKSREAKAIGFISFRTNKLSLIDILRFQDAVPMGENMMIKNERSKLFSLKDD